MVPTKHCTRTMDWLHRARQTQISKVEISGRKKKQKRIRAERAKLSTTQPTPPTSWVQETNARPMDEIQESTPNTNEPFTDAQEPTKEIDLPSELLSDDSWRIMDVFESSRDYEGMFNVFD